MTLKNVRADVLRDFALAAAIDAVIAKGWPIVWDEAIPLFREASKRLKRRPGNRQQLESCIHAAEIQLIKLRRELQSYVAR